MGVGNNGVERWGRGGRPPRVTPSEEVTPKPKRIFFIVLEKYHNFKNVYFGE